MDKQAYQVFLQSLHTGLGLTSDSDSEYNYEEDEIQEKEEFRSDRYVQIPQKEVAQLSKLANTDLKCIVEYAG